MLKENFKALGAVVGGGLINAFKPFIKVLNSVLQKVISFAEMVTNALGSIFGWRYEASKGAGISGLADDIGSASNGMDDLSDAAGSAGKNTGGIAKNAKKAKKEIQQATRAFDELKVISKQSKDNTSGSGSGGSGGGSGSGGSGGGDVGKLVQTDTIFKDYESKIKDLEGLGESIRDALVKAVGGIEWDKVYAKASGFGTGLAEFLNGLFSEDKKGNSVFTATADVIAGALNTAIFASKGFTDKFDFETFGKNVAHGFNRFFKKFKWKQCAEAINGWVDGFWETAKGFFSTLSWKDIFNGLSTFLNSLSTETITTIIGAAVLKKFGESLCGSLTGAASSWFEENGISLSVGEATLAIGTMLVTFTVLKFLDENNIPSKIAKWIKELPSKIKLPTGKATGWDGKQVKISIPLSAAFDNITFKIKHIKWSDILENVFNFDETGGFFDEMKKNFKTAFDGKRSDIMDMGSYIFEGIVDGFIGAVSFILEPFHDFYVWVRDGIKDAFGIHSPAKKMKPLGENIFLGVIEGWKEKIASFSFSKYAKELMKKVKDGFDGLKNNYVEFEAKVKNEAKEWWADTKKYWSEKVGKVKDFTTNVKNNAKDWWKNTKTWWSEKVGKVESFTTGVKNKASEWWSNVKKWWESAISGKEVKKFTANVKKDGGTWWKDVSKDWNEKVVNAGKTLKIGISFAKNALSNLWSSVTGFFGGKTVNVSTKATKKADGGVFSGGSWKPIKKYAVGGLPNMGQMFVAREAGPELVGTLGGHTAVMNNDQIVSSVSAGVAQAVKEVIQPLVKTSVGNNRPIQISLDGKVIFDSTRQSAQEYFNRTGMSPFPV